uniref:Kazal-like domain-containing protein n=1 Tax=Oryzias sinensis TaxID=183150 RepID=A0A8C7ZQI9_9TELE
SMDRPCSCNLYLRCHKNYEPVCGSNGDTYQNECYRRQASCKQQRLISRVSDGPCSVGESAPPKTPPDAGFKGYTERLKLI